ncbi:hypothetical protein ACJIZ3_025563 [Penstemon smallii]|uniref:Uncharacterized protein n=1 Tax=Penstemon smallii TaxID=265156 RepID=A0ABD3TVZ9_9LAMI
MLTSQGLVLATAMAVSAGTVILFDHFREKHFLPFLIHRNNQDSSLGEKKLLKSCLSSGEQRKGKKKRVKFADDVKDSRGNGELYRKERRKSAENQSHSCGVIEFKNMPGNRVALYSGILKNRVQRMGYSC